MSYYPKLIGFKHCCSLLPDTYEVRVVSRFSQVNHDYIDYLIKTEFHLFLGFYVLNFAQYQMTIKYAPIHNLFFHIYTYKFIRYNNIMATLIIVKFLHFFSSSQV